MNRRKYMNKLLGTTFFMLVMASMMCGCATRIVELEDGTVRRVREILPQVGVVVTIQNNCAPMLSIQSLHGTEVKSLAFGKSATIPVSSRPFSGYNREIWVMIRAYDSSMNYLGSAEMREYADISNGTRDKLWQVDDLDSPPRAKCPAAP
jgi:hypothetical protein